MRFGERFPKRVCENLLCKFYRFSNNASADSRWVDTIRDGQLLYRVQQELATIIFPDGREESLDGNLIHRFPFGSRLLTMVEFAKALGLQSNTMPSERVLNAYRFPRSVTFPKCRIELKFTFTPKLAILMCPGPLAQQILNRWLHNRPIPRKRHRTDL
jgi:hypothetical protein